MSKHHVILAAIAVSVLVTLNDLFAGIVVMTIVFMAILGATTLVFCVAEGWADHCQYERQRRAQLEQRKAELEVSRRPSKARRAAKGK